MITLWRMSIYGCRAVLLVLIGRRLMRRYTKEYSYCLWCLVLGRLLLPVFFISSYSALPLRYEEKVLRLFAGPFWSALYGLGVLAVFGYFLTQYVRTRYRLRTAVREMKNIWRSEAVSSAFVMGLFAPRIYLPCGLEGTERWYVVQHEQMHIRHLDLWIRTAGAAALCLHWWNPAVWYAVYKMQEDMEMWCDEAVLKECAGPEQKVYANVLLNLSVKQSGLQGICFGESCTEQRIRNILASKKQMPPGVQFLFFAALQVGIRICF